MKKFLRKNWYLLTQFTLLVVLITALALLHSHGVKSREAKNKAIDIILTYSLEEAYFEGQKGVLEGDVRIEMKEDSSYIWAKSPWDTGKKPIFNPQEH